MKALLFLLSAGSLAGQPLVEGVATILDVPREIQADPGRYRLELVSGWAEVVVERSRGGWQTVASNRAPTGIQKTLEWDLDDGAWRVRLPESGSVTVRLTRLQFGGLKDSLSQLLQPQPDLLRLRVERSWPGSGLRSALGLAEAPETGLTTRWGLMRVVSDPPRVERAMANGMGWEDLRLPVHRGVKSLLAGWTEDGFYVLLSGENSWFYRWEGSWQALPAPMTQAEPWSLSQGAGNLWLLEKGPVLRRYDGESWQPPLDLAPLGSVREGLVLGPSTWSRTGVLILASDKIRVYDLP